MGAKLIYHVKEFHEDGTLMEIKIWQVRETKDKPHGLKYSLAYVVGKERVIGYDNAEGKGDHRHCKGKENPYKFESLDKLWGDFLRDIKRFKEGKL